MAQIFVIRTNKHKFFSNKHFFISQQDVLQSNYFVDVKRVFHAKYAAGLQMLLLLGLILYTMTFSKDDSYLGGDESANPLSQAVRDFLPRWLGLWEGAIISCLLCFKTFVFVEYIFIKGVS